METKVQLQVQTGSQSSAVYAQWMDRNLQQQQQQQA